MIILPESKLKLVRQIKVCQNDTLSNKSLFQSDCHILPALVGDDALCRSMAGCGTGECWIPER